MKRFLFVVMFVLFVTSMGFADTIYLKSGRVVKGDILEKTEDQIKVNANGITLTYYADEVDRIEGASGAATPPSAIVSPPSTVTAKKKSTVVSDTSLLDKKELTLKYMEVTGAKGNMRRTFAEIIDSAAPDKKAELTRVLNLDEILAEMVPIYDQYFSDQDLRELIAFYESPLGQKVIKTSPLILKDTMDKSIKYFESKGQ